MRQRDRQKLSTTFHGAGMVVPYDRKTQVWSQIILVTFYSGSTLVMTCVGIPEPGPDPRGFGPLGVGSISHRYGYGSDSGSGSFIFLIKVLSRLK
jgi:hypothetical protein